MAAFNFVHLPFFISFLACLAQATFFGSMEFNGGAQRSPRRDHAALVLDLKSGSEIESKEEFLFGRFEMLIKLVPGDSAGTVTAFYLSSVGEKHDEIDFEFLGNTSGQPYIIHTNIFIQGIGGREEQFHPWFDPTARFHNYTIHWTPSQVVWYVDSIPIRVFEKYNIPYPEQQAMRVYSSIWNGDSWASKGGIVKIDWTKAPFVAQLRRFRVRPANSTQLITIHKRAQMEQIRSKFLIYGYCNDPERYNGYLPTECLIKQY